jgi:phosphoglycolate phosphatase
MRRTAILFDLDGTLVDTAPDLHDALNAALAAQGRAGVSAASVRMMVGDGARKLVERGLAATGAMTDAAVEAGTAHFLQHYAANLSRLSRPFPGVVETLAELKGGGCHLAVCTNKLARFSERLLEDLGLARYFDAVVGGDSLSARKPDPGHITGTLARLGVGPESAAMVGDSANDVLAARGAGVPVIVVSFGYTRTPPGELGADALIDHFAELPAAIAGLD